MSEPAKIHVEVDTFFIGMAIIIAAFILLPSRKPGSDEDWKTYGAYRVKLLSHEQMTQLAKKDFGRLIGTLRIENP